MLNAFLTENTLAGVLFLLIAGAAAWYGILTAAAELAGRRYAAPVEARASAAALLSLVSLVSLCAMFQP